MYAHCYMGDIDTSKAGVHDAMSSASSGTLPPVGTPLNNSNIPPGSSTALSLTATTCLVSSAAFATSTSLSIPTITNSTSDSNTNTSISSSAPATDPVISSLFVRSTSTTLNVTDKSDDNLDSCSKSSDTSCNLVIAEDTSTTSGNVSGKTAGLNKSQKNLAERAKKTPWYNAIYPSYKSRTEDFKKLFRDALDDERLIVDYSCAIQKDILVHGRLYVTQNYLYFHAKILSWETRLSIRLKAVTSITKEKTARVIPNAILVCTDDDKHFLTSFTSRDKAYLMLFRVWQNALMDKPINQQELWQWVHTCYGDQLGLTSDDEDYIDPYDQKIEQDVDIAEAKPSCEEIIVGDDQIIMAKETTKTKKTKVATTFNATTATGESTLSTPTELLPTDMSDSTESEQEQEEILAMVECNSLHSGRQLVHTILPINVDILFELLFSKSKFLTEFHNTRKTTDMIHGEWKVNKEGLKERVVSLTIAITQTIGPRSAHVTETQVMRDCSKPGQLYSIDVNAVQGGIPYADSFYVTQHYCMSRTKDDHTVLSVHAQVHYRKNIFGFVRGFIEKNTWVGLEDFYNALLRSLQSEYCIPPARSKSRRSRKPIPSHHGIKILEEPTARSTPLPTLPQSRRVASKNNISHTFFSWFVVILLIILLSINVALYLKLANLEGENENLLKGGSSARDVDKKILQNPPQSHADWLALLHEQEAQHAQEMVKWQHILHTVTDLLKKVSSICENIPRNVTQNAVGDGGLGSISKEEL